MASIKLKSVWIHLLADPDQRLEFTYRGSESHEVELRGEVRHYANGRRRAVRRRGVAKGMPLRLSAVERDQWETLESWVGQTVMVRDPVGNVFYGVYFRPTAEELYPRDLLDASLNVESITV